FLVANLARVFQHKDSPWLHLFRKPLRHYVQLCHHGHLRHSVSPFWTRIQARSRLYELRLLPGFRVACFCAGRRLNISARTSFTASLKQTPSKGWREFLRMSITWRCEFSR